MAAHEKFEVAGVCLKRPFRVRRLGHFNYFSSDVAASLEFYCNALGFQVTDKTDLGPRIQSDELRARCGDAHLYFMRFASDHHSFVLCSPVVLEILLGSMPVETEIGQITWQVGSLREVMAGNDWLTGRGHTIQRVGRESPGYNWHTYFADPDGRTNEIYYGIEQIGWNGLSRPTSMAGTPRRTAPALPIIPEYQEVERAREAGIDMGSGTCSLERLEPRFDVDGVLLPRPFKIVDIGPVRLFTEDMPAALEFYGETLGLTLTETITYNGHECFFLRAAGEHHVMALYPAALREELGLGQRRTFSFGIRVHGYQQLVAALAFLRDEGYEIRHFPQALFPGMGHNVFAVDPGGHLVQFYSEMEAIGWDGSPRPASERPPIDNKAWPATLDEGADTFTGPPFLGPWG